MKNPKKLIVPSIIILVAFAIVYMLYRKKSQYNQALQNFIAWITMERNKGSKSDQAEWVAQIELNAEKKGITWEMAAANAFRYMNPSWISFTG